MTILLLLAVCFLAYSNGANDNFKGVASLFGSKTTGYRTAIGWATVCTFAGSVAAIFLAQALLSKFSGKGLVPDSLVGSEYFLLAVAVGAGVTVILATLTGFPISTTHALTGAMVGSGWVAVGSQVNLGLLGKAFFLPLLLSPVLAVALGASLYLIFRWSRLRLGITKEWCICIGKEQKIVPMPQPSSVLALQAIAPTISACMDEQSQCEQRYARDFFGIGCQKAMDAAHFLSAGIVSFARGLNDTPKIAALLLILPELGARSSLVAVAVAIAVGGLLSARRVAETMSHKITSMNHGQSFSGQSRHRFAGLVSEFIRAACVHDAGIGRGTLWYRIDNPTGRLPSDPQHFAFVVGHVTVRGNDWCFGLLVYETLRWQTICSERYYCCSAFDLFNQSTLMGEITPLLFWIF